MTPNIEALKQAAEADIARGANTKYHPQTVLMLCNEIARLEQQLSAVPVHNKTQLLTPTELRELHYKHELGWLCAFEDLVKLAPVIEQATLKKNGETK